MNELAADFWKAANEALIVARHDLEVSPKAAASRAYYAAFYAASGLFAVRGQVFRKHTAVEAAVHRELVNTGLWEGELGESYSRLLRTRNLGDYRVDQAVTREDAEKAIQAAEAILRAVAKAQPDQFPDISDA